MPIFTKRCAKACAKKIDCYRFNKVSRTDVTVLVRSVVVTVQIEHTIVLVLVIVTTNSKNNTTTVIVTVIGYLHRQSRVNINLF